MSIIRKSNITFDRWDDFKSVVQKMIDENDENLYQKLANIHADQHHIHSFGKNHDLLGLRRFLPWHRAYLIAFERELRKKDSTLSLPYWDWDNDQGQLIGFSDFLGLPSTTRDLGQLADDDSNDSKKPKWFSNVKNTQRLETLRDVTYDDFARDLESLHNAGHSWVGGTMADPMKSPNDIAFWLHHAAIDRVWAKWQAVNPGKYAESLIGDEEKLDPWQSEFNIKNINEISNLGTDSYSYEDPKR